jgi:hypothetical protein
MIFLRFFFCDFSQVFCSFFEVNKSLDDESQSVWLSTGHVPVGTDTASITFFYILLALMSGSIYINHSYLNNDRADQKSRGCSSIFLYIYFLNKDVLSYNFILVNYYN